MKLTKRYDLIFCEADKLWGWNVDFIHFLDHPLVPFMIVETYKKRELYENKQNMAKRYNFSNRKS